MIPVPTAGDDTSPGPPLVRSYKRRGRLRAAQATALEDLWPRFGVDLGDGPLDPVMLFGRDAPLVVEIGFGTGDATLAMAAAEPDRDVLAVEVYRPGAAALLKELDAGGVPNVRVAVADAVLVLTEHLAPDSLDELRIFFPDPWPKARHHKRRLVDGPFVALAASRLRPAGSRGSDDPGGRLHLTTDWQDYADQMLTAVGSEPLLHNAFGGFAARPAGRPLTRFERQGLDRGHTVRDVVVHRR